MKVDWQKIEYIHKSGRLYESKCKDESFTLNYKESFKGLPKNAGFFHFIITKGCDIRYYINNHKIKDREEFSKNKFKLTLFGNFDILNPKRKIDFGAGLNQNIIGGYNSIADAMNVAQSICEGLIESLITGKPNNNFSRESKKLLIEKKDDVIFTRNRVNNDRAIERKFGRRK
jgi:hypothetical protein